MIFKYRDMKKQASKLSRRKFCKNTALASGALISAPLDAISSAHVQGDDSIKIALIGCGGRGTGAAAQA